MKHPIAVLMVVAAIVGNACAIEVAHAASNDSVRQALWRSAFDCNVDLAAIAISQLKNVNFNFTEQSPMTRGGQDNPLQRFIQTRMDYVNSGSSTAELADRCLVIIQKLLAAKADPNFRSPVGNTALHAATNGEHQDPVLVKVLLAAGANPNAKGAIWKDTPLMSLVVWRDPFASYREKERRSVWDILLPVTDLNAQNELGDTVLMKAAEAGNIEAVKDLLGRNADTKLKNKKGKTASDMALEKGNLDVVKLLTSLPG